MEKVPKIDTKKAAESAKKAAESAKESAKKAAESAKKLLRIAPQPEEKGEGFLPSSFSRWVNVGKKTGYNAHDYEKYGGKRKVLVLCTDQKYVEMKNGNRFSTGNNPIETMLPMMHFQEAGIDFDICTPTGAPVALEMWALPEQDTPVQEFFKANYSRFQTPIALGGIVYTLKDDSPYIGVFIPGGHGAMNLGIPENADIGKLLKFVHKNDLFLITLSHGPAALLSLSNKRPHPYQGYSIATFPDITEKMLTSVGFLPGSIPWSVAQYLEVLEITIANKRAAGMVKKDRKFLSGDGPKAANALGKLAVDCILDEIHALELTWLN